MNTNLDPIGFSRNYLEKMSRLPERPPTEDVSLPKDVWYEQGTKNVPSQPPTLSQFDNDIKKLQAADAPQRTVEEYLGMALITSVMTAVQMGGSPLSSSIYLSLAANIGKEMIPPQVDSEITKESVSSLISTYGLSQDETLNSRAREITSKLTHFSSLTDLNVHVLNSDHINANALPGNLFVTKGLLENFSDGETALILGHELAHIEDRDSIEDEGRNLFDQLAVSRTLLKSKVQLDDTSWNIGDYRKQLKDSSMESNLAFKRENESAADKRGVQLMLQAGYNGEDAVNAIAKICAIERDMQLKIIKNAVIKELGYLDETEVEKRIKEQERFSAYLPPEQRVEAVKQAVNDVEKRISK